MAENKNIKNDEDIRNALKSFKAITKKDHFCLDCGYKGVMGSQYKYEGALGYLSFFFAFFLR